MARLPAQEVQALDPYAFLAVLGKRVIHPGGRASTDRLLEWAAIRPVRRVLDIGCGVGMTAIRLAHITVLPYPDASFDVVLAEAVTMFVDRGKAAAELARVCKPGGRVLATEFCWRRPPTDRAREVFLGQVCPGLRFDTEAEWAQIYAGAGLADVRTEMGPFAMMTARGFFADEGAHALSVVARVLSRPAYLRKMAWLMPRMFAAVPYLGYVVVEARKPAAVLQEA